MIELFTNVPQQTKNRLKFWLEMLSKEKNPIIWSKKILEFRESLQTEEEKEFVDFYINYLGELKKNEDNSNRE